MRDGLAIAVRSVDSLADADLDGDISAREGARRSLHKPPSRARATLVFFLLFQTDCCVGGLARRLRRMVPARAFLPAGARAAALTLRGPAKLGGQRRG